VQLYRRCLLTGADSALVHVAGEVIRRPSLAEQIPPREAYRRMIAAAPNTEAALAWIDEARRQSEAQGESLAVWDLAELEEHVEAGHAEEASAMIGRINSRYPNDPDVAAALYQLLYRLGAIRPEDMAADLEADEAMSPEPVGAAAESPSRIWTPDSDRPAGGKSALWTPS
jgi:hypothetical protein